MYVMKGRRLGGLIRVNFDQQMGFYNFMYEYARFEIVFSVFIIATLFWNTFDATRFRDTMQLRSVAHVLELGLSDQQDTTLQMRCVRELIKHSELGDCMSLAQSL